MSDTHTANIRIENFPRDLSIRLNAVCTRLQLTKKEVVKLALKEFVEKYSNG